MYQVKRTARPRHYITILLFLCIASLFLCHFLDKPKTVTIKGVTIIIPVASNAPLQDKILPPATQTTTYTIHRGETLSTLFNRAELGSPLLQVILKSKTASQYLSHLQQNQTVSITKDQQGQLLLLTYPINIAETLQVIKQNQGFQTNVIKAPVTKTVLFRSTTIHKSLSGAEHATGLPPHLQYELNQMLTSPGFAHYVHPGEQLDVLYHEYFVGGEKYHPGNIVAIQVSKKNDTHKLVRFTAPDKQTGFYLPNGQSTQTGFLQTPLHYQRVGSYFTYHRMDPVVHRERPHLGVDLDAPKGTPIKAIGNGVVVLRQWVKGYGNTVMIRYYNSYKTLYGHMEKFATNLHVNEHVKKGQIVGYVGSTGWSTGPHVHYSLYKNGTPINPLTAKLPLANPVPARYRGDFAYEERHWFNDMKLYETNNNAHKV